MSFPILYAKGTTTFSDMGMTVQYGTCTGGTCIPQEQTGV